MSSEPPEEPLSRSEYNTLSPASPKPIHLPTPTDIPILNMQTDVGFNQTEAHPAMRNTETRPDIWQDPDEQLAEPVQETTIDASPYSTGADAPMAEEGQEEAGEPPLQSETGDQRTVEEISASTANLQPTPISNPTPNQADATISTEVTTETQPTDPSTVSDGPTLSIPDATAAAPPDAFSAQTDEVKLDQMVSSGDNGALQGLLNSLAPSPAANGTSLPAHGMPNPIPVEANDPLSVHPDAPAAPGVGAGSSPLSASNLGVPPSGLPPRPPPQEQPLINPNYAHSQHIRDYHPHATNSAYQPHGHSATQANAADPSGRNFVPPVGSPGSNAQSSNGMPSNAMYSPSTAAAGGAGMASYASTPASAVPSFTPNQGTFPFQYPQAGVPAAAGNDASRHAGRRPEDRPWDAEVQRKYDRFLEEERRYVAEGRWEQFPQGSRLFVGNLSSERVTKRDIFHVFHTYGELAQISIKQAYGFVQFLRAEDCMQALEAEQGTQIRDKKIHLEVSKPQKNRPQAQQRRSRSPPDQRNRQNANVDRYNGGRAGNNRRDDYRPGRRSPSPRGYRDRYDDRYRRRSPSPPSYGGRGGGRYRSPTPRGGEDDDLPLPSRKPHEVPDVQIIVLDSLDRDFINWVEKAFLSRSVRVDALILSPRLNEQAVMRRQIVEGVLAVVRLTRQNQNTGQIGLQIFDRSAGAGNVRFEEYDNLPPPTCAELVVREKSKIAAAPRPSSGYAYGANTQPQPPQQQQYGYPPAPQQGYPPQQPTGYPPNYGQPVPAQTPQGSVPSHLQSLITNLDPQNLQSLLSAMNTPQSAASNAYGGAAPNSAAVQTLQQNPGLAGYLQQQQQQQQQYGQQQPPAAAVGAGQVNMQEILARLGSGGGR